MRNQPVNKRIQGVKTAGRLSLFAKIAWNKDIGKDTQRENNMDEIRLRDKEKKNG